MKENAPNETTYVTEIHKSSIKKVAQDQGRSSGSANLTQLKLTKYLNMKANIKSKQYIYSL